jgi:hypothetical protein
VSLQIAILKVLVSHPEGRATISALNSDLCILNTSGSDWTDRLRRLAARAPGLDIFDQRLVLRDNSGWQITPEGRTFLNLLEAGASCILGRIFAAPTPATAIAAGRCEATATACETWTVCRPKTAACLRALGVKFVTVPCRSARTCHRVLGATSPLFRSRERSLDSLSDSPGASFQTTGMG